MTIPAAPSADAAPPGTPQRRLFLIHGLSGGCSEKVAVELTTHWAATGHPTALVTLATASDDRYPIASNVERIALDELKASRGPFSAVFANLRRIRRIREAVRSFAPDVVVSFNDRTNVLAALALRQRNYPLIVSERVDPRARPREAIWSALRRWTYPTADAVVVPSEGMRRWAESIVGRAPVEVVPNACWSYDPAQDAPPDDSDRETVVLGMGRLDRQKGFDLLIDAFAQVSPRRPEWRLRIVGDGPERGALLQRASRAEIADKVEILPWTNDPTEHWRTAKVFVLSSRYEGFPNVLVEALAAGLPAIAFDCPSGPADILRSGTDGLLVEAEDAFGLAAALHRMLGDDAFRVACGRRALDVRRRFSPESVFAKWESVLRSASNLRR